MNTDSLFENGRMNRMAQVDEMSNNAEEIDSSDNKHTVNTNKLIYINCNLFINNHVQELTNITDFLFSRFKSKRSQIMLKPLSWSDINSINFKGVSRKSI